MFEHTLDKDKNRRRKLVRDDLPRIQGVLNEALAGKDLKNLEPILERIGRGGKIPHWFAQLSKEGTLPNADGKTIGSILEMLLVAIIESSTLKCENIKLHVNPARGVDLPDLDLGVKSPSTNYCTSEPFFSAYERLFGNENDCIVLLTDYQLAKKRGPLKLQVLKTKYMEASEIADKELCKLAVKSRDWLQKSEEDVPTTQRVFKFLAYANQSDWRCRRLLSLLDLVHEDMTKFNSQLAIIEKDFIKTNKARDKKGVLTIPDVDLLSLRKIFSAKDQVLALINQLENWVTEFLKDASRNPNDNEWKRLLRSPLNGKIGMSFALQWRYNFGQLFGAKDALSERAAIILESDTNPDDAHE